MKVLYSIASLLLLVGVHPVSAFSIDASAEVAAARPEVEVEFDLDPESKAQWGGYAASRSDRPVLEGRTGPMGMKIRPLGGAKVKPAIPMSTVLKPEGFNFGRGTAYVTTEDMEEGGELLSLPMMWSSIFQFGENEDEVVLAPVLDTIGICTALDEQGDEACPKTRIKLDTSTQRLVLMLSNGFARDRASKLDKLDLTVTLDPSDTLAPLKNYLLQTQLNESVNATYGFFYGSAQIDDAISTSLKMKLLSGAELSRYKELLTPAEGEEDRRIVSLRNEFVFTRAVISTCTTLLTSTRLQSSKTKESSLNYQITTTSRVSARQMFSAS
ncbi:Rubisco LSMT, substrate-binding domain [Phytophthora cactorum]|nr:Rubisco LSMT, substrate-binding domain [Phytophthora cactorum]